MTGTAPRAATVQQLAIDRQARSCAWSTRAPRAFIKTTISDFRQYERAARALTDKTGNGGGTS
jgi:hypothetical protein